MPLVSKAFGDIITFTRASTGTFFNSAGVLTSAAIDAPRLDYNPSTLAAQGLLIEEARTNSIRNNTMQGAVNSTGIASATVASGGTGYTVGNVLTVSGGTGTAATFTVTGASAGVITSVSVTTAGSYTVFPTSPVSVTGGSGSGATFNIVLNGTLPTNWAVSGLGTLTQTVVGTGTENGVTYIDVRFNGTTSTTQLTIRFEPSTQIAAANGQSWSISQFLRTAGGSLSNITGVGLTMSIFDSGGSYLADTGSGDITITSTLTRQSRSGTIVSASAAFIRPIFYVNFASGVAIDITLRIGLPQLEQGAFATSVIPTTTTALTRSADVASVNTLAPWFNASVGTLFAEFMMPQLGRAGRIAAVDDGAFTNMIDLTTTALNGVAIEAVAAGVYGGFAGAVGSITANTTQKSAFTFSTSANETACLNAGSVGSNAVTLPSVAFTRLLLGRQSNGVELCGYLRRLTFYPRQLSNAELQAITA